MSKRYIFKDIVIQKNGFLRGPFGGDLKKEIFVEKGSDTYKVYEQGVVLNSDKNIGRYYISEKDYLKKLHRFSVQDKDFLVSCSGVNMGAIYQLNAPFEKGIINQALLRVRLNNELVDDNYFYYLFKRLICKKITSGSGDSTIPNFPGLETIKNVDFELPEKPVQEGIGKILSALDSKIELNNRINAELEAMAKTLYDYWFVQFDFPDRDGKPYKTGGGKMVWNDELKREIPDGWEVGNIGNIVSNIKDVEEVKTNLELPYVPIDNLPMRKLISAESSPNEEARSSLVLFKKYDVLLGAMRVYFHRVCLAIEDGITRTTVFVLRSKEMYLRYFSLFTINTDASIGFATINSKGSTMPYTFWENGYEKFRIVIPPKELLLKFNEIIEPILEKSIVNEKQNKQLAELRDWLLPMLMNGQVTVGAAENSETAHS